MLYFQLHEGGNSVAVNLGSFGVAFNADYLGTPARTVATENGDLAVRFNSEDDYLQTDAVAPESLGGNPTFTAEALYYVPPGGIASDYAPFLHWGGSGTDATMKSVFFGFHFNDAARLYVGFYDGGLRTVDPVPRGAWHHVVWVRQGGGAANVGSTLYVDGVSVALESDPVLPFNGSTPAVAPTEFRIDRGRNHARWFTGSLDEIALYDRALTAGEVAEHYAAIVRCEGDGACVDYDGGCRVCGRPAGGSTTTATDALAVLRTAVGLRKCNLCICDVDHSGTIVATDALVTLRFAVEQPVVLDCTP